MTENRSNIFTVPLVNLGKPSTGTGILGPCSSNRWQTNCKNSNSVDLSSARRDETAIEGQ